MLLSIIRYEKYYYSMGQRLQLQMASSSGQKHVHIEDNNTENGKNHDQHKEVEPINHQGVFSTAGKIGKSHGSYFKVMSEHKPSTQFKAINQKQLAEHTSADSAWLSFKGIVYDATTYLKYHPGGNKLLEGCGRECDVLFNKYHPWVNAQYLLEKYKIGFVQKGHHSPPNTLGI